MVQDQTELFYVWLLEYSILLKARHYELIHESITLHNRKLLQRQMVNHESVTQK